ncbi:MAG: response regulator transcription factor [Bacteroidales bacterium]|nr:response regulator transcription factor [Bacteroidales bacterium]
MAIRVVLFEDNKNFREALSKFFSLEEDIHLVEAYTNANNAIANIRKHEPDVVLMDIEMPGISGLDAMRKIKKVSPETKVLIQTQFDDEHRIFVALCYGASGYVLKGPEPDEIKTAIIEVNEGGGHFSPGIAAKVIKFFREDLVKAQPDYIALTPRQEEVLEHLCQGLSYKMIADKMGLKFNGVAAHIKEIYKRLHVNSAPEAIIRAIELKLIVK